MRVPRELDELMWAVAEQRNPETNAQFLERYPEFAEELDRRVAMVNNLRGSRPVSSPQRFVPSESVRTFGPSRFAVVGVSILVLASVTFAAYATLEFVNRGRSPRPVVESTTQDIVFNPPDFEVPTSTTGSTGSQDFAEGREVPTQPETVGVPNVQDDSAAFDPYAGRVTIDEEEIALSDAIEEICTKAGLRVTLAPGFEEKRIRIRFVNQPAIDIIEKMGATFGFTAFKQGKVELLIIPQTGGRGTIGPNVEGAVGVAGATGTTGTGGPEIKNTAGGSGG